MRVHTATTPLPATTVLGRNPTPSTSGYNALPKEKYGDENAGNGGQTSPLPTHMSKAGFSALGATNRDGNPTNKEHHGQLSVKNGKRGACEQKAATVLPNRTAAA